MPDFATPEPLDAFFYESKRPVVHLRNSFERHLLRACQAKSLGSLAAGARFAGMNVTTYRRRLVAIGLLEPAK